MKQHGRETETERQADTRKTPGVKNEFSDYPLDEIRRKEGHEVAGTSVNHEVKVSGAEAVLAGRSTER